MKKRKIIKTRIFSLIFAIAFIVSFCMTFKANAKDMPFKLTSVIIADKSETVTGNITYSDNDEIKNNVVFHKVNDNITYKLTIKNNVGKDIKLLSITDDNKNEYVIYEYEKHENEDLKADASFELLVKATYKKELTDINKREQASNVKITISYLEDGKSKEKDIIINPTTGDKINGSFILLIISASGLIVCMVLDKKRKTKKISTIAIAGLLAAPIIAKTATVSFSIEFKSDYKLYDKQVISYEINGTTKKIAVPYNETITELETPSKNGYTFVKWTYEDGTDFDSSKQITDDIKIVPVFNIMEYDINYDLDGGIVLPENKTKYTVEDKVTLIEPVKPYYTFIGWTGTDLTEPTKNLVIENKTGDRSYKAEYTPIDYTITYTGLTNEEKASLNNKTTYNIETTSFTLSNPANRTDEYGNETEVFTGWKENETTSSTITLPNVNSMGNKTFEAQWTEAAPTTYTITYELNGGTVSVANPTEFTNKTETFTLNNPTLIGHTFKGWSGTDLTGEENKTVKVEKGTRKNLSFEAHYTANTYTVSFDKNAENVEGTMNDQTLTYGQSSNLNKNNYSKEGYTFNSWNTKVNGTGTKYDDEESVLNLLTEGTITLHAQWDANDYEIEFVANHANVQGSMNNLSMKYDNAKSLTANAFTLEGYNFVEWNTKADGSGDSYANKAEVNNLATTGIVKLYAQWAPVQAVITFNKNNTNATGTMNNQTITYDVETGLSLLGYELTGYTFDSWNTKADGTGTKYENNENVTNKFTSNTTLYAQWNANNYEIEFVANHDGVSVEMSNLPMVYDTPKELPNNLFTVTGYNFVEWNTKADGSGDSYANKAEVNNLATTGTVKLYAQWSPVQAVITFNKNNTNATGTMNNQTITYDEATTLYANSFERAGYTFTKWNTREDGSGTSYENEENIINKFIENTSLYAQWKANDYVIQFVGNHENIDVEMSNLSMVYDTPKQLTANLFTVTGYNFVEWNTKADGTGNSYVDEELVSNLATTGTVKLYAQWSPKQAVITFDKNSSEATGTMNNQTVTYDEETTLSENGFTRTNYAFKNWNTKADGSGTSYEDKSDITNVFTENTTLYAQWEYVNIVITFDTDGGSAVSPIFISQGDSIGELPTTTKDNYIFRGWYVSLDDENPIDETYSPEDSVMLHAKWDMLLCKKATTLHTETCNQTDNSKFCSGAGHSNGDIITYGSIVKSDNYVAGDAFDCNVDGTGYNQRFYYLRTANDKAILISNKNFTAASGQADQNISFIYSQAHDQLPTTSQWNTLPVTFDGKAARLITMEDILDFTGATSASKLNPTGSLNAYEFLFENSNYSGIGERSTQWLEEVSPTSRYRYRNDQRSLAAVESGKENTSKNPVRPVIEVPLNLIDDSYIINFDPNGGTVDNEFVIVKRGSKLNSLPTPTNGDNIFDGWYTSLEYTSKVSENTIPDDYKTYYAKWVVSADNAQFASNSFHLEIGNSSDIIISNINNLEPITFTSSDPTIASVDSDGIITALSEGTTTIVITGTQTHKTATVSVTVATTIDYYRVSFDEQGGEEVADMDVPKNQPIGTLPTTTKTDYDLEGWYTNTNYTTKVTSSTIIDSNKTYHAKWIPSNTVAESNGKYYTDIQTAIDKATDAKTTVKLLKDIEIDTIIDLSSKNTSKDIVLDLNGHTITNNTTQVIKNKASLEIKNGTISCGANNGAVDVEQGGHLIINSGRIEHTATESNGRAAIYNNGGTVEIGGNAYITAQADGSTSAKRATVQNVKGNLTITGGTIVSTRQSNSYAVTVTAGTVVIGTKDDIYDKDAITIRANTNGISSAVAYSLYDGTVEGLNAAVSNEAHITGIEDNATKVNTTINISGVNYKALYYELESSKYKISLDPNGGTVNPTSKSIDIGSPVGELPVPENGIYTFDGWYDGTTLVTAETIPTENTTYTAQWHYEASDEIKEFSITNDAIKDYYAGINTWKNNQNTFQSNMDANFNAHNCKCNENTCSTSGTVLCDKPKGYDTGIDDVVVYESNETTKVKGNVASYLTAKNGVIYNMIPGETYYWESASDSNVYGYVKALGERRFLDTEGTRNVRDLGGLKVDVDNDGTIDGTLKYGKLFRGERLYSDSNNALAIKKLGVTEEIDLRATSEIPSNEAKLEGFKHREIKHYQLNYETQNDYYLLTRNVVKEVMQDVIDGKNIYFHCRIGTDRTGTLAYILEGLLGVNQEEMLEDYELSYFFGLVNRHRYYSEDPKSSVSKTEKFVYMYNLMPDSEGVYDWFMLGSTEETRAADIKLINDFRAAMINYN